MIVRQALFVAKILKISTPKFEHIVVASEEIHDFSDYFLDELITSL